MLVRRHGRGVNLRGTSGQVGVGKGVAAEEMSAGVVVVAVEVVVVVAAEVVVVVVVVVVCWKLNEPV